MRLISQILLLVSLLFGCFDAAQAQPVRQRVWQSPGRTQPDPRYRQPLSQDPRRQPTQTSSRPDNQAEQLYLAGRRYIEQGFYSEGLEALNQSLALRPNYAPALTYKGIALRALREPNLALEQFNAALAAAPNDGVAHGERALTYVVLGQQEKAAEDLREAARTRPDLNQWFTHQSKWVAENRQFMNRAPETPAPGSTEAVTPPPPATPPDPESDATGDSESSRTFFDLSGATSILKPALFTVFGYIGLILALYVALVLTRLLYRRFTRPWQSRMHAEHEQDAFPARATPPDDNAIPTAGETSPLHPDHEPTAVPFPKRRYLRRRHRVLLALTSLGFLVILFFAAPALYTAFRLDADKLTAPRVRPSVLDYRGNIYTHLGVPDSPIEYSDLPTHLVDALRAREDSRFFEHNGVDWIGFTRALVANVRHGRFKQGASTLTMQLTEHAYKLDQKGNLNKVRSKLVEWIMAYRGEGALTERLGDKRAAKEAIMTAYLNRVEFGGGTVGVGAASFYYFDKPVSELTLGESCMLVALLRAPTANSPYRNPDNSRLARDKIVEQMLRRDFITEDQAKQARFFVVDNPRSPQPKHNGYLVAAITREMNSLKEEGKLPDDVWDHESLVIQSTLDLAAQDVLDSEIRKVISGFRGDTEKDPLLGTGMIVDNLSGVFRALVSGLDLILSQYDLAFSSRRQVASIAKPFVYAAYLEQGGDISAVASNAPLTEDEVRALNNWNPRNSSSLKTGTHPLSSGLAFSDNNITVRVGLSAGLRRVYDSLYTAGLVSDKTTTGTTWLLGTFESSLANVVSAYTAIPRGGTRATPYLVQTVAIEGKEVYRAEPAETRLFTNRTARQLHQALLEAMTHGTGRTAIKNAGLTTAVAGKTGTSQSSADVWWVGYTDNVTLGVRFGRNSNTSLGNAAAGGTMAAPTAARVLKKLVELR